MLAMSLDNQLWNKQNKEEATTRNVFNTFVDDEV